MRPSFHPRLINDPFSDPGLFIPFLFEKRALMFDLGNVGRLSSGDLLKITHVFVTHTHMDHFIGFDELLRLFLGRNKTLNLYGPPGFFHHLEGKLHGYTWNLVHEYENDFSMVVHEVHETQVLSKTYACRSRFRSEARTEATGFSGLLLEEPAFSVKAVHLDHRIPCLGLSLEERLYVNIIKGRLKEQRLPVGPWLNRFKAAIYDQKDPGAPFSVSWKDQDGLVHEKAFILGDLTNAIARMTPGQKIVYITDVLGSAENVSKILELARGADALFIEAAFLHEDLDLARKKYHLTARQAGDIARRAGAKSVQLFHFSPRYRGREATLEGEAREAYAGDTYRD